MNAYELADLLAECIDDGSTDLVCVCDAVNMLRQQADRIAELEKDSASLEKSFDDCLNRLKIKARALKKIEKIIEEGNQDK